MLAPTQSGQRIRRSVRLHVLGSSRASTTSCFIPFFLEGVATDPALNQADGIHPNREGVAVIVESIWDEVLILTARVYADQS